MKKLIIAILLLASFNCFSQGGFTKPNNSYGTVSNRASIDSILFFPTGCGTPTLRGYDLHKGAQYFDSCAHVFYVYDPALATWGTVGGGNYLDSFWRVSGIDSNYYRINGVTYAVLDSTGGGGVTSVTGTTNRITSTGGTTPAIDIAAAYDDSIRKWIQDSIAAHPSGQPVITKSPLITLSHIGPDPYDSLAIIKSDSLNNGYISSVDWNRFNTGTDSSKRTIQADNYVLNNLFTGSRKGLYLQNRYGNSPPIFMGNYSGYGGGYFPWLRMYSGGAQSGGVKTTLYIDGNTDSTNVGWVNYLALSNLQATFSGSVSTPQLVATRGYIGNGNWSMQGISIGGNYPNPMTLFEATSPNYGTLISRGSTTNRLKLGSGVYKATITTGGTGYTGTSGSYTGGSGTGQIGAINQSGGVVNVITFAFNTGSGYKVGDVLGFSAGGGTGFTATVTKLQGDTACGLLYYDTTLNRMFSWNCSNHAWAPIGQNPHSIYTPTTGGTVTTTAYVDNVINPAGALAALTIALPSSPYNNDKVYLNFTQTITTITYSGGTVVGKPTTATAGQQWYLIYDLTTNTWY